MERHSVIRLVFLTALCAGVRAGFTRLGGPCSTLNNRLDPASFKFVSECSDTAFCSGPHNGSCQPRLCRRDEFLFGFDASLQSLPPLCGSGFFCPDEGSGCQPQQTLGGSCQMNRDEQCAPPPDWRELASPRNSNGSICLHSVCMAASASLGDACVKDTTKYLDFGPDKKRHNYTISRDNCRSGYFCHSSNFVCTPTKDIGSFCQYDNECTTRYCGADWRCAHLHAHLNVPKWQLAIVFVMMLFGIITTCILLNLVHARLKRRHEREMREYYMDQLSLRRAIIALHAAVAEGNMDAYWSFDDGRSIRKSMYDSYQF